MCRDGGESTGNMVAGDYKDESTPLYVYQCAVREFIILTTVYRDLYHYVIYMRVASLDGSIFGMGISTQTSDVLDAIYYNNVPDHNTPISDCKEVVDAVVTFVGSIHQLAKNANVDEYSIGDYVIKRYKHHATDDMTVLQCDTLVAFDLIKEAENVTPSAQYKCLRSYVYQNVP